MPLFPLPLLAPILIMAVAVLAGLRPGPRPRALPRHAETAALGALALAVAGLVQLVAFGPAVVAIGGGAARIGFRLDALAATTSILVAFVGWVVVRYSRTYLDGDGRGPARRHRRGACPP